MMISSYFFAIVVVLALGGEVMYTSPVRNSRCPKKGFEMRDERWLFFNDSCYLYVRMDVLGHHWEGANMECRHRDAHLAVIRTAEENEFIVENVLPEPIDDKDVHNYGMWIGLHLKWATCDGCNYVEVGESSRNRAKNTTLANTQSANWIDGTPLEASALLPSPITQLTNKYGKYPWLSGDSAQPDRFGKDEGCAHYFDTEGFSVGDWGLAACDITLHAAICQKKALMP